MATHKDKQKQQGPRPQRQRPNATPRSTAGRANEAVVKPPATRAADNDALVTAVSGRALKDVHAGAPAAPRPAAPGAKPAAGPAAPGAPAAPGTKPAEQKTEAPTSGTPADKPKRQSPDKAPQKEQTPTASSAAMVQPERMGWTNTDQKLHKSMAEALAASATAPDFKGSIATGIGGGGVAGGDAVAQQLQALERRLQRIERAMP